MEALLKKLTPTEIEAICFFANNYINQIPYITLANVKGLDKEYLIKAIKTNRYTLSDTTVRLLSNITNKNLEILK